MTWPPKPLKLRAKEKEFLKCVCSQLMPAFSTSEPPYALIHVLMSAVTAAYEAAENKDDTIEIYKNAVNFMIQGLLACQQRMQKCTSNLKN